MPIADRATLEPDTAPDISALLERSNPVNAYCNALGLDLHDPTRARIWLLVEAFRNSGSPALHDVDLAFEEVPGHFLQFLQQCSVQWGWSATRVHVVDVPRTLATLRDHVRHDSYHWVPTPLVWRSEPIDPAHPHAEEQVAAASRAMHERIQRVIDAAVRFGPGATLYYVYTNGEVQQTPSEIVGGIVVFTVCFSVLVHNEHNVLTRWDWNTRDTWERKL